jgi:hypothetical protein
MISISRSLARQFRAVARRAGLNRPGSIGNACMRLIATKDALTLQASNGHAAVEYRRIGQFDAADITVPLQLFADCEAKSEAVVTIRVEEPNRLIAAWTDRGVPQQRDYTIPATTPEMPAISKDLVTNGPGLLTALREAKATADVSSTRYSLSCIQLRGATGTLVATDSHQMLVQSGFRFAWQEDLLLQATEVFACKELPSHLPVEIGRTEDGVTVRVGEWTLHHEIDKVGRFPQVDRTIPPQTAIRTRMQVDAADAKFLADTVNRLPADDLTDRPITVELNGEVAVRARKDEQSPLTELILSRSRRVGDQMRVHTNRQFLSRALELGFSEIGFVDNKSPCVCQDATRTYVWMVLEPDEAIATSAAAQRIESWSVLGNGTTHDRSTIGKNTTAAKSEVASPTSTVIAAPVSTPVNRVSGRLSQRTNSVSTSRDELIPSTESPQSTDVIEQALALRNQLRTIVQGLTDVVTQIRQQRKQTRLMKSTLQSLKQLQLLDA